MYSNLSLIINKMNNYALLRNQLQFQKKTLKDKSDLVVENCNSLLNMVKPKLGIESRNSYFNTAESGKRLFL